MTQLKYLVIATLLLVSGCVQGEALSSGGDDPVSDEREASAPRRPCASDADGGRGDCEGLPQQGEPCPRGVCDRGLSCISYYGIAGPAGGLFTSCEIPCGRTRECPEGQRCVTIADGPGIVCRPVGR